MGKCIIILHDQLNLKISSLAEYDKKNDTVFICETLSEMQRNHHHKLKLAFIISSMRNFAKEIQNLGYQVRYVRIEEKNNSQTLKKEIIKAYKSIKPTKIVITEPSEWHTTKIIMSTKKEIKCPLEIINDDRFYCTKDDFKKIVKDKESVVMEFFYRKMRKDNNILMKNGKPVEGKWNFDASNRASIPKETKIPEHTSFKKNKITIQAIDVVNEYFSKNPGDTNNFYFATTKKEAQQVLKKFINDRLNNFGKYQDAMLNNDPWLFHSHISFYLNNGLLLPKIVVKEIEKAYHDKKAPISSAEGFIRQIVGWREFVRGIYWAKMPKYADSNFFNAKRKLPEWFWHKGNSMQCLSRSIANTMDNAYAHHIQRLMVIGNFTLLTEIDPKDVQNWYLSVYADAYEWVEMPNVVGMILYADAGYLASKPYIASGNYINKMSDYCQNCKFKVKEKTGKTACPFNYLYWNFLIKHRKKLEKNSRLFFPYNNIKKMSKEQIQEIQKNSNKFIKEINESTTKIDKE